MKKQILISCVLFLSVVFAVGQNKTSTVSDYRFTARTNLLYDLASAPNLGFEWRASESFGVVVNGAWAHTNWKGGDRKFRLWLANPEVRYYFGGQKQIHVGAEFKVGEFNMLQSDTGYQGDYIGGGLTVGYQIRLSDTFNLEFNTGVGYLNFKYDSYNRIDKIEVLKNPGNTRNYFGPTQLGVVLVWKIK